MAIITRNTIRDLLRPGLNLIYNDHSSFPEFWKSIFETRKSERAEEFIVEMEALPVGSLKPEGRALNSASFRERYITTFRHETYGQAVTITREAIEDNLYHAQGMELGTQLKRSMNVLKHQVAMKLFNTAFSVESTMADGQPLCSLNHPIGSDKKQANMPLVNTALSEAALEEAISAINYFRAANDTPVYYHSVALLVPPALASTASRLVNSPDDPSTANRSINPINHMGAFPKGVIVSPYLTSPTAWFVLTNCNGLLHFLRTPLKHNETVNENGSITMAAYERFSFGCYNWRSVYGSPGR